jgi:hypothetical protein
VTPKGESRHESSIDQAAGYGLPIHSPEGSDFVVLVRLKEDVEYYVLPMPEVATHFRPKLLTGGWAACRFHKDETKQWRDRWQLIVTHLT